MRANVLVTFLCVVVVVGGCSTIPSEIRNPASDDFTIRQAQQESNEYLEKAVRWGGEIAGIENRDGVTWIEIVGKPLDVQGRPYDVDSSGGRFVARIDGFLDPAIYRKDRKITIYGTFERIAEGRVGGQPYRYPIVHTQSTYLWDHD